MADPTSGGCNWAVRRWQQPAGAAGGDFVVCRQDARFLRIFLGDVAGHGDRVAPAADLIGSLIHSRLDDGLSESTLLKWSRLTEHHLPGRFVAFTFIEIDLTRGHARIAVGGNPALIVRSGGGGGLEYFEADGMPLGMVEAHEWVSPTIRGIDLSIGDQMICFTDGLIDTVGRHGCRRYGSDRVHSVLAGAHQTTPVHSLSSTRNSFASPNVEQDDVTVLCVHNAMSKAA